MFFFYPFDLQSQPLSNRAYGGGSLPLLPASGSAKTTLRGGLGAIDFEDFFVDLVRKTITAFTASLTALGNAANALFAQLTATLSWDRVARDNATFLGGVFGAQKAQGLSFFPYRPDLQDPMAFSPLLTQGFNPFAINPWTAFAEGLNFWASLWMPAAAQRVSQRNAPPQNFMAKVSTPNGFTWGFSWGV